MRKIRRMIGRRRRMVQKKRREDTLINPMIHNTSTINASTLFSLRYAFCQLTKVEGTSSVILSRGDTSGTTTLWLLAFLTSPSPYTCLNLITSLSDEYY
jgi:hypothetical protein